MFNTIADLFLSPLTHPKQTNVALTNNPQYLDQLAADGVTSIYHGHNKVNNNTPDFGYQYHTSAGQHIPIRSVDKPTTSKKYDAFTYVHRQTPTSHVEVIGSRPSETIVFGDLDGSYEKFFDMLTSQTPPVVRVEADGSLTWIGGNTKIVYIGDAIADKASNTPVNPNDPNSPTNQQMVAQTILDLQNKAQVDGGSVTFIAGNHEDILLAALDPNGRQSIHVEETDIDWYIQ